MDLVSLSKYTSGRYIYINSFVIELNIGNPLNSGRGNDIFVEDFLLYDISFQTKQKF